MQSNIILVVAAMIISYTAHSQPLSVSNARAESLSDINLCDDHNYAFFTNIAGIVGDKNSAVSAGFTNYYQITGLNSGFFYAVGGSDRFKTGISAESIGDDVFRQSSLSIGIAHRLGRFAIGLKGNYYNITAEGTSTNYHTSIDIGGKFQINDLWTYALVVNNISIANSFYDDFTAVETGIRFTPSDQISVQGAYFFKNLHRPDHDMGVSMEYSLLIPLKLRVGYKVLIQKMNAGFGVEFGQFSLDYALAWHTSLGTVNSVGLLLKL